METDGNGALIDLHDVVKTYETGAGDITVLKDITLQVQSGEFISVVGPSGSGKSTLLNMITGIDRPTSGEVLVEDTAVHTLSEGKLAEWRGRNVGRGEQETAQAAQPRIVDEEKAALNKRLETIGWGCFLIMLGGFMFVPHTVVAKGFWSIGVGVIMLGLNAARYFYKIKMSGFTTFLGVISLISGILQLLGLHTLEGAVLLVVLGAYLIVKPWFDKKQIFGKAEEG